VFFETFINPSFPAFVSGFHCFENFSHEEWFIDAPLGLWQTFTTIPKKGNTVPAPNGECKFISLGTADTQDFESCSNWIFVFQAYSAFRFV
jgi:hypothetical protein